MKQILFFISLSAFWTTNLNAQWYQVNTNTTENLYDIFFVDSLEGYCVGDNGIILRTSDGGENWSTLANTDSLSLKNLAVVEQNGFLKLYAFGTKNGNTFEISTALSTSPPPNWLPNSIDYKPKDTKVSNNEIFFIDVGFGEGLKKISENSIINVIHNSNILSYYIDINGITFLDINLDTAFILIDNSNILQSLPPWSSNIMSGNNSLNTLIFRQNNTVIIKATYPSMIVFSQNNGLTWNSNFGGGEGPSIITETGTVVSLGLSHSQIYTTYDFGANWYSDTLNDVIFNSLSSIHYSEHNDCIFVMAENGKMYKNSNLLTSGVSELFSKKTIEIFPNPINGLLHIEVPNGVVIEHIEWYDVLGKKVKTHNGNHTTLNIADIPEGTYLIKFHTNEGITTKQLVIM